MRVAFVAGHMTGRGGSESLLKAVVPRLEARGHLVSCWISDRSDDPNWEEMVHPRYYVSPEEPVCRSLLGADWHWAHAACLQERLARAGTAPDVAVVMSPVLAPVARLAVGRRTPVLTWMQATVRAFGDMVRFLRFADGHLAIARGLEEELKQVTPEIPVHYVPLGVSQDAAPVTRAARTTFLYIGRLDNRQKRLDKLLRALQPFRGQSWELRVIGDGADRAALQQLATQLGIDTHVHWEGFHPDPWTLVQAATALVLPSDWEGFGLVLVESLVRGVPVVASDCPVGPGDIVRHGENGWLFPPQDVGALQRLLGGIIGGHVRLPQPEVCRASAARFSVEDMVSKLENVFNNVVALR
ncbi:putative Glycosyl transferase group 1 [Candidatus Hydrogenisulfobacillus filiaventi]|uniref:Putative Glycosyl transferase group 1 n=1 Tax=Candidatus Hydrogenisulfobacillus filiaventi TaxID=2707344 RepID=A0A6F8ZDL5_9FIRM|nr:putative Glycosyl transferase group 1 [Candidatus Hydrogenisulfobacillus filiaventi]